MTSPTDALRPVRLWHHQQMVQAQDRAKTCAATTECAKQLAAAQKHQAFVLLLDGFFMAGDTAEQDAARTRTPL